jgi:hypothetical protein
VKRRRVVVGGVAALVCALGALLAALAFAQDEVPITITVTTKVTPNRAGTPKHPQGIRIDVRAKIGIPSDYDPPLVQHVDVWFPRGGLYNGAKYPACNLRLLGRRGPSICPKRSIMGHATATARADTVFTHPKITVINGGATRVYFYTVLQVPARVAEPVVGNIVAMPGDPKWSYHLRVSIPKNLQIVAGIPLRLDEVHGTAGRGDWLATTSCPRDHRWRWHAEGSFSTGQVVKYDGSVGCRS